MPIHLMWRMIVWWCPRGQTIFSSRRWIAFFITKKSASNYTPILTDSGRESLKIDNAGGSSSISEALSISLFEDKFKAFNFVYENKVNYVIKYKMVDYICSINFGDIINIGVSVSRGVYRPMTRKNRYIIFDDSDARNLLFKKLNGLIISQQTIHEDMNFYYAVLHIWCLDEHIEQTIIKVFEEFRNQPEYDNIILMTTVSDYAPIYKQNMSIFKRDYCL